MDPVEDATRRRLQALEAGNKALTFEDDYMDTEVGTRGLIRIIGPDGEVAGLEFVEPEEFWFDPDAVDEYRDTVSDGFHVTVIVPPNEVEDATAFLNEELGSAVQVLGYDRSEAPLGFSV